MPSTPHQQQKHSDRQHISFSQLEGAIEEEAASMDRVSNRAYEEYDPSIEWSRGAEADSVKIVLPGKPREIEDDDAASLLFFRDLSCETN